MQARWFGYPPNRPRAGVGDDPDSEGPAGRVAPARRADPDERHPLGPCDGAPRRLGVEADERALADGDLLAVDPVDARAADDDVDLLLAARRLVVLAALRVRRQLEPVDPERLHSELPAHEADGASRAGRLELGDVENG